MKVIGLLCRHMCILSKLCTHMHKRKLKNYKLIFINILAYLLNALYIYKINYI
jgi:hypothetical protein